MGPIKILIKSEFADVLDGAIDFPWKQVRKIYESLEDRHSCGIRFTTRVSLNSCKPEIDSEDEEIRDDIFKTKVERKTLYVTSTTEDFPLTTEDVEGASDGLVESSSISANSSKNENQTSDFHNSNIYNRSTEQEVMIESSSTSDDEIIPEDKIQDEPISKSNDFDKGEDEDENEIKTEVKPEDEVQLGILIDFDSLTPNVKENENEIEIETIAEVKIEAEAEAEVKIETIAEVKIEIERDGKTIVAESNDTESKPEVNVDVEMVDVSVKGEFNSNISNKVPDSIVENNDVGICGDHPFDAADTGIVHVNASSLSASESKESYVKAHKLQNIPFRLDEPELEPEPEINSEL
ncbi:hypothetical protein AYI69_g4759 [Smittium culicis]|uniref:Uncharacterized protein n=1 Tax=Smittium culicis TaxID=133412 RepID=A0A1R1YB06_9FUNG|nr:hypothetical protein AYI69_g4759 [Smittium culicis]